MILNTGGSASNIFTYLFVAFVSAIHVKWFLVQCHALSSVRLYGRHRDEELSPNSIVGSNNP